MDDKPEPGEVTRLLQEIAQGNRVAESELAPLVYDELRRLASRFMRQERDGHTLQTTALVHEVYLRLIGSSQVSWADRGHFFAVASRMMRRILVDHAREKLAAKRGAGGVRVELSESVAIANGERWDEILDVHHALDRLAAVDARMAQMIELRFFGGLGTNEIAKLLGVSLRTIHRDWDFAQTWLVEQMQPRSKEDAPR